MLAPAKSEPKFKDLGQGEKFNQSLVNKHFVLIDQWGQGVQLIIYETKSRNLKGLCLALSLVSKLHEFCANHMGRGDSWWLAAFQGKKG